MTGSLSHSYRTRRTTQREQDGQIWRKTDYSSSFTAVPLNHVARKTAGLVWERVIAALMSSFKCYEFVRLHDFLMVAVSFSQRPGWRREDGQSWWIFFWLSAAKQTQNSLVRMSILGWPHLISLKLRHRSRRYRCDFFLFFFEIHTHPLPITNYMNNNSISKRCTVRCRRPQHLDLFYWSLEISKL